MSLPAVVALLSDTSDKSASDLWPLHEDAILLELETEQRSLKLEVFRIVQTALRGTTDVDRKSVV